MRIYKKKEPKPIGELIDAFIGNLSKKDHKPDNKEKRIKMIYKIAYYKLKWDKKRTFLYIMDKFPEVCKRMDKELKEDKLHYSLGATFLTMTEKEMRRCVTIFLGLEKKAVADAVAVAGTGVAGYQEIIIGAVINGK